MVDDQGTGEAEGPMLVISNLGVSPLLFLSVCRCNGRILADAPSDCFVPSEDAGQLCAGVGRDR